MNSKRVRILKEGEVRVGPVALWMSRDQRVKDNDGPLFAQEFSMKQSSPLLALTVCSLCMVSEH